VFCEADGFLGTLSGACSAVPSCMTTASPRRLCSKNPKEPMLKKSPEAYTSRAMLAWVGSVEKRAATAKSFHHCSGDLDLELDFADGW
jgi:hypothetical protein